MQKGKRVRGKKGERTDKGEIKIEWGMIDREVEKDGK